MSALVYYFHIPRDYTEYLGDVHWARNGEAVEYPDKSTFAFDSQIGLFLEGLAATRGLLHFGHVLHLLHLLGLGKHMMPGSAPELEQAFRKVGRPLRNAGAFCGLLCRRVPVVPGDLDAAAVCRQLYSGSMMSILYVSWNQGLPEGAGAAAPLSPLEFERRVLVALAAYAPEDIEHWLKHGRGPIKGAEQLARELETLQPRSLNHVLANLTRRPRLAGAVPFVAQLVSALTLPPRRRTEHELPTGGYADVTTHGHPEQLLPSQFALDEMEFLRRFAENELLYFRREEPHARTQEELILLLDQGVRTWGDVRLLLSAAVLAFGKRAARRGMPLRLAGTSTLGHLLDPLEASEEELGELLDASDLTANPALALEGVLETPADKPRDVVLLTHPRSLAEPDVSVAARRALGVTRLFGLSADGDGRVELSQVKRGVPVTLARFRVDLTQPVPLPEHRPPTDGLPPWRGDVESVPFPFRLGLLNKVDQQKFDFDHDGHWLITLTQGVFLHAFKLDGSVMELLPRGMLDGKLLDAPQAILGVVGGCIATGQIDQQLVVVHYDFVKRICTTYALGEANDEPWQWFYFHEYHAVVARHRTSCYGVDLATGTCHSVCIENAVTSSRTDRACLASWKLLGPRNRLLVSYRAPAAVIVPTLFLEGDTGTITLADERGCGESITRFADGRPLLRDAKLSGPVQYQGRIVAFNYTLPGARDTFRLFVLRASDGALLGDFPQLAPDAGFALSWNGALLARLFKARSRLHLEVRDLSRDVVRFVTPLGQRHPGFLAELGRMQLAVFIGKMTHLIGWNDARLELSFSRTARYEFLDRKTSKWIPASEVATQDDLRRFPGFDDRRFLRAARGDVTLLVDHFGHVAILDRAGAVVCVFFIFRDRVAAWMPDGTRLGPSALTGSAETPNARERIGQALFRASQTGGEIPS